VTAVAPALAASLRGVRVLDASRVLAGPYAGQVLADLGADVIKVESPQGGDETRGWGPPFVGDPAGGMSAYYMAANRGKRAITLDLKRAEGRSLLHRLAAASDVLLENFRAESLAALGMTTAALHRANPRLIICSLSGYGREGPWGDKPGYDFAVQGLSGLMAATGPVAGPPYKVGVAVADLVTGLYAAVAVLAALRGRAESGQGYAIELALLDCAAATMANVAQSFLTGGKAPARVGNAHLQIVPYELFATKDGHIVLAVGNDGQWRRFCAAAGRPELGADARYALNADRVRSRAELVPIVAAIMGTRTTAAWQAALDQVGVPAGPVWSVEQLLQSDLAAARGLKLVARRADGTSVELLRSPLHRDGNGGGAPPEHGEHTRTVLREVLGVSDGELARLAAEGVI
jgi:crotonobetainyl-CoA:carnitine CoA-transferase CaiB-like acyl-CoA transferase